jgi:hypothetical protein
LGDQRNDGESNFNSGDGMGQMAQPWMFMMIIISSQNLNINNSVNLAKDDPKIFE